MRISQVIKSTLAVAVIAGAVAAVNSQSQQPRADEVVSTGPEPAISRLSPVSGGLSTPIKISPKQVGNDQIYVTFDVAQLGQQGPFKLADGGMTVTPCGNRSASDCQAIEQQLAGQTILLFVSNREGQMSEGAAYLVKP